MPAARTLPRGRLLSFRLSSLMLLFVVVSAPLAIATNRAHTQRAAVEALRKAGVKVYYDYEMVGQFKRHRGANRNTGNLPGPNWLRNWLGIDYVGRVRGVQLDSDAKPDATTWERLGTLDDLTELYLDDVKLNDAKLRQLKGLHNLQRLRITGASIDNGLAVLTGFPQLKSLVLERCRLSDQAFEHLRACEKLHELSLADSGLSDARLGRLTSFVNLRMLDASGGNISDEGLAALASMQSLESLQLKDTLVTGAGLAHLPRPELLTELSMRHTLLDEAGLVRLKRFPSLRSLDVSDNPITIRELVPLLALPNLQEVQFDVVAASTKAVDRIHEFQELTRQWQASTERQSRHDASLPFRIGLIKERLSQRNAANGWFEAAAAFDYAAAQSHELPAEAATALAQRIVGIDYLYPREQISPLGGIIVVDDLVPIPQIARLKIDALFQTIARRGDRPGLVFLAWAGTTPRTLAHEEAARWIAALPRGGVSWELFHDITALEDHALSCLAAAAALDAGPRAWVALVDSLPPNLQAKAAAAWVRSDPDNAAAWYGTAGCGAEMDGGSLLPRYEEISAAIKQGNRCPHLRIGALWSSASIHRVAPLLDEEFNFRFNSSAVFRYERSWCNLAEQAYRNAIQLSAELGVAGRLAQAEELQLAADEMLRQLIAAPPRESHTVIDGFHVALAVLNDPIGPDESTPEIIARRRMRSHAIRTQLEDVGWSSVFLRDLVSIGKELWLDAAGWPHFHDDNMNFIGHEAVNAEIDAWEQEDRRLQTMPKEEIIALNATIQNTNDMDQYLNNHHLEVPEVADDSDK